MKTHIIMFAVLVTLQAGIVNITQASGYAPPPAPTINKKTIVNDHSGYAPGTAVAGVSGLCVKDWKPGWQKCAGWTMIDVEDDETMHAFGGGVTTRVDQFAVHLFAGIEDIEGDDTTVLIGGSLNWR